MTPTLKRNEYGLIEGLEHKKDKFGYIIWRDMISPEYLYPNKEYFERRNQQVPETTEGLPDNQCLVKIGGLIELMRIRGYTSLDQQVLNVDNGYVTAKCTITWLPNFETDNKPVTFSWVANSNIGNCGDFMAHYQETQAQNRALSLCIRKFLNVNIVSDEEISKGETKLIPEKEAPQSTLPKIQNKLRERLKNLGLTSKDEFKNKLKELSQSGKFEYSDEWESCDSVPTKEARIILGLLEK